MIRGVLAQTTVTDLNAAEDWYGRLLDRQPDARPMPGLLEWHLGDGFGLQVWSEPERAGRSTVVLQDTDLDGTAARLAERGVSQAGAEPGGGGRIIQLLDPDGNRLVLVGD